MSFEPRVHTAVTHLIDDVASPPPATAATPLEVVGGVGYGFARPDDPVSAPVVKLAPSELQQFRAQLAMAHVNGGALGVAMMPGIVARAIKRTIDDLKPQHETSFFHLPGHVQDAVREEMKTAKHGTKAYKAIVQLATSNGFLQHSAAVEREMVAGINRWPNDSSFHKEMFHLAQNPDFGALPELDKLQVVKSFIAHGNDPTARTVIRKMAEAPGFKLLDRAHRQVLLDHVAGSDYFSPIGREKMKKVLDNENFKAMTPEKQAEVFQRFVDTKLYSPELVDFEAEDLIGHERPYSISKPTQVKKFGYSSGKADALRYEVEIDGRKIPVIIPKNPDAKLKTLTIEQVAKSLASMPKEARAQIKRVQVEPLRDPDDAKSAKKFKDPEFRAFMAAGSAGVVFVYPTPGDKTTEAIVGSMVHETGHTISRKTWGEDPPKDKGWAPWREAIKSDGPAPSRYGDNNPSEDFAETWQLYFEVRGTDEEARARATFPARFALIDKLLAPKKKK